MEETKKSATNEGALLRSIENVAKVIEPSMVLEYRGVDYSIQTRENEGLASIHLSGKPLPEHYSDLVSENIIIFVDRMEMRADEGWCVQIRVKAPTTRRAMCQLVEALIDKTKDAIGAPEGKKNEKITSGDYAEGYPSSPGKEAEKGEYVTYTIADKKGARMFGVDMHPDLFRTGSLDHRLRALLVQVQTKYAGYISVSWRVEKARSGDFTHYRDDLGPLKIALSEYLLDIPGGLDIPGI